MRVTTGKLRTALGTGATGPLGKPVGYALVKFDGFGIGFEQICPKK